MSEALHVVRRTGVNLSSTSRGGSLESLARTDSTEQVFADLETLHANTYK